MNRMFLARRYNFPWLKIIICIWALLIIPGEIARLMEEASDPKDWMNVVVEIVPQPEGPPDIRYKAIVDRPIDGTWTATPRLAQGARTATRKGDGDYRPNGRAPVPWPWEAWFEDRYASPPPAEPSVPYRVCVEYRMTSVNTGVVKDSDLFCSRLYDPRTKTFVSADDPRQ